MSFFPKADQIEVMDYADWRKKHRHYRLGPDCKTQWITHKIEIFVVPHEGAGLDHLTVAYCTECKELFMGVH